MIYSRPRPSAPTTPSVSATVTRSEHDSAMQALSRLKDAEIAALKARVAELEGAAVEADDGAAQQKRGKRGG